MPGADAVNLSRIPIRSRFCISRNGSVLGLNAEGPQASNGLFASGFLVYFFLCFRYFVVGFLFGFWTDFFTDYNS